MTGNILPLLILPPRHSIFDPLTQVQPFRMAQQNDRLRGARVGNFAYVQHALHLGGLSGNLFDIILRNVRGR